MMAAKAMRGFPFFTMKVQNMRGWQLYVGNSFWLIFVGLMFLLVDALIKMTGVDSHVVSFVQKHTKQVMTGENVDSTYASGVLAEFKH